MAIVYTHSKKSGDIFYIGIGLDNSRAYSKANRNKHWHNTVNKHGLDVNIVKYDIEWSEACKIKRLKILKIIINKKILVINKIYGFNVCIFAL
jgi:hypothetical protein